MPLSNVSNTNGNSNNRIVAVEEDEFLQHALTTPEEDFIPGPPSKRPTTNPSSGSSVGSSGGGHRYGSILGRVLNASKGKTARAKSNSDQHDVLQLSNTDHKLYMAGSGILASREDLNLSSEACK